MSMAREHYVALDSWRGICALLVVLFHFPISGLVSAAPIVANGYLFVDFFFVLSGFVIATAYGDALDEPNSLWRFLVRRFGRLWPLHATILAVFVAISLVKGNFGADNQHSATSVVTNILMIHGLGIEPSLTWNGPSWSISVEWALYLVFGLLAAVTWRRMAYLMLVVIGALVLAFQAPFHAASTFDYGLFRGFAGFFTGALLTYAPRLRLGGGMEFAVAGLLAAFVCLGQWLFLAPLVFGAVVYVFARSDGILSRMLRWRPFVLLGEWSYSTYMVHTLLVAAIWNLAVPLGLTPVPGGHLSASLPRELALVTAYAIATVGVSAVTYTFVEKPGRAWFNRLALARFPAPAAASRQRLG